MDCNAGLVKNATGYDFRHLLIGSEGTLGLLAEIDVQLTSAPEPQVVMVLGVPKVGDLLSILEAFNARLQPSAFEFFSDVALEKVRAHRDLPAPLAQAEAFYALVEFDASANDAAEAAFVACMESGWVSDGVVSQSEAQAAALWQLREGISKPSLPTHPIKMTCRCALATYRNFLMTLTLTSPKAFRILKCAGMDTLATAIYI